MKHVLAVMVALLAILSWTFAGTIIELASYRDANAQGLCHVAGADYATDARARLQREQCLAAADSQAGTVEILLRAVHLR